MNHTAAALLMIGLGLAWLIPFVRFWWMMTAATWRIVPRFRAWPEYRPRRFNWRAEMGRYVRTVEPDSDDAKKLRRGTRGLWLMLLLLGVVMAGLMIFVSSRAPAVK